MTLEVEKDLGFERDLVVRRWRYEKQSALARRVKEEEGGNKLRKIQT